jgi:hypothetical protein
VGWDPDKEDNSGRTPQYRVTAGRGAGTRAAASEPPPQALPAQVIMEVGRLVTLGT